MQKQIYTLNVLSKPAWFKRSVSLVMMLGLCLSAFAQSTVTGKVTDENGDGLPGAAVQIQGTATGSVTDMDGDYSIEATSDATLVVSFIGYVSQSFAVGSRSVIDVNLTPDAEQLEEVIVIGYGQTQNSRTVSTAITKVTAKDIERLPVSRPEQALQGTAPGIIVMQESGSPGSPLTLRIRGVSSANNAAPLYIVDGVQVPSLQYMNSADIDNINVLKDAASASIYGARGGNGVVLVTTKNGKRNTKTPKVSINGFYGVQSLATKPDLMNKDQFIEYYNNSVDWYTAHTDGSTIPDLNGDGTRDDKFSTADAAALPDTDWYDEVFNEASMYNLHGSVQGGGDDYSYAFSSGLFTQNGIVGGDQDKSNFTRKSVKFDFEKDLAKGLNVRASTTFSSVDNNSLNVNQAGTGVAIMNYVGAIPAIYPTHDENGELFNPGRQNPVPNVGSVNLPIVGAVTNPLWSMEITNINTKVDVNVLSFGASYERFGFKLNSTYSYIGLDVKNKSFTPVADYPVQTFTVTDATLTENYTDFRRSQWENTLSYDLTDQGDHDLTLLLGTSVIEDVSTIGSASGTGLFVNNLNDAEFALMHVPTDINVTPNQITENGWLSFFGRVNYAFKEKYLFSATLRSDAASKFSPDNRRGFFPSVSAGWNVSEESFLQGSGFIDLLKVRASWGVNGNDQINSSYAYLNTLNTNSQYILGGQQTLGIAPATLANESIKWEEVSQFNVGIDANLLNNRVGLTLDYYEKKTSDMLAPVGVPALAGPASFSNVAEVKNSGLEIILSHKNTLDNGLKYNVGFNLATINNEVTDLGLGQPISSANIQPSWSEPIARTDEGQPIASFYGFKVESIDDEGNLVFADIDGVDGITDDDKTYIGNPYADFTYGVTVELEYKGFDISAFLFGSQGNDIYKAYLRPDAANTNKPAEFVNSWTDTNTNSGLARSTLFGQNGNLGRVSDYYIEDGSFSRLKTLTLGYTLPSAFASKISASKIRFYVTIQNLFTNTDYSGADPEIGQSSGNQFLDVGIDRGFYPQPRTVMGGFQINLF